MSHLAISPLDGRYHDKVNEVSKYFSTFAWVKFRLTIEIDYLISLVKLIEKRDISFLIELYKNFDIIELEKILEIEKTTKHDIKAIEYYIGSKIEEHKNLIHFGLTSQDINSVAFSLQLRGSMNKIIIPGIFNIKNKLMSISKEWKDITILAYTHGQPAVPTKLGKEIDVFVRKIYYWHNQLINFHYFTKFGGAVGNMSAHKLAYRDINWDSFFDEFIRKYNLIKWQTTTQITNYDDTINLFNYLQNINNVMLNLCQNMWMYIHKNYFNLKKENSEQVGSSTMPQKINPIDFENAEGNLIMANSILSGLSQKLALSRLQRDLSDSTMIRNVGVPLSHSLLAYKNILKGLDKLCLNQEEISNDLLQHPECMSEAFQILLRKYNIPDAYNIMRIITQGRKFNNLDEIKIEIIDYLKENVQDCPKDLLIEINQINIFTY